MNWEYWVRLARNWTLPVVKLGGLQFAQRLVGLALTIGIARSVGPEGAGQYYLILAVSGIGTQICSLGLARVVVRFVPLFGGSAGVRRLHLACLRLVLVASTAGALLLAPAGFWLLPIDPLLVILGALLLVSGATLGLTAQSLVGIDRQLQAQSLRLLSTVITVIGLLASWSLLQTDVLRDILIFMVVGQVGTSVLGWHLLPRGGEGADIEVSRRVLLASGLEALGATLATGLSQRADVLLLRLVSSDAVVGIYGAALQVVSLPSGLLSSVIPFFAPKVAKHHAAGGSAQTRRILRSTVVVMLPTAVIAYGAIWVWAGPILNLLLGPSFAGAAAPLRVLVFGYAIALAVGPTGNFLLMTGQERVLRRITVGAAGMHLLALSVLAATSWVGAVSVAGVRAGVIGARNLATAYMANRDHGASTQP